MALQVVTKHNPHTFELLPRRWVVERTFAWISNTGAPPAIMSTCPPATKP
jgi:transposase